MVALAVGSETLQEAYDAAPAVPQIVIPAATPLTLQAAVATQDIFQIQNSAAATIFTVADDEARLDDIRLLINDALDGGAAYSMEAADTFSPTALIGGVMTSTGTITISGATFIWALLSENKTYRSASNPGFAAFTLFNALPVLNNLGNFNPLNALVLNVGVVHERTSSGTSSIATMTGVNFAPQSRALVSGAVMTKTNQIAVNVAPTWSTVAGSTVNLGTITGMLCVEPGPALFQPSAGVENLTAYRGVDFPNFTTFTGTQTIEVIRSALNSGTNRHFLNHTGTAESDHLGNFNLNGDFPNGLLRHGAGLDYVQGWLNASSELFCQIVTPAITQWRYSAPAANRLLMQNSTFSGSEINFNYDRFSLGAQSGANGNQVGNFVAGARTVSVAGEWSDFLLTQAANITVDAAMSLVAGWTINAPSITLGTGTVTSAGALNIGGNVNQGSVNRFGLRILSNPSGGSGVNAALWVTAGLSRFDGRVDINQPIALGGGAAATLGTIGGSGPTTAAQAQWVEIDINGVAHWIPAWT